MLYVFGGRMHSFTKCVGGIKSSWKLFSGLTSEPYKRDIHSRDVNYGEKMDIQSFHYIRIDITNERVGGIKV